MDDRLIQLIRSLDFSKTAQNKEKLRSFLKDRFLDSKQEAELTDDELLSAAGGLYQPKAEDAKD